MDFDFFLDNPNFPVDKEKDTWPWLPERYSSQLTLNSDLPRISIITPSYNQGQYIEETIRSVLLQNYSNLEYIIIDGGSTDNTVEIIKRYEPWLTYWVSEPDQGQAHAINKGFQRAAGDLLAWLNADDVYLPNALFHIANARQQYKAEWIVGITLVADMDLKVVDRFVPQMNTGHWKKKNYRSQGWLDLVMNHQSGTALPQPSSFWSKDAISKVGGIDESLRYNMDHELYGRMAYQGFRPVLIDKELAYFRMHHEQKTSTYPLSFWEEELLIVYDWANRVNGVEKEKLENYGGWLKRKIKLYQFRSFYQLTKSRFKKLLNYLFGSYYKRIKVHFESRWS